MINDDARHFFHTTGRRFDQVVFGCLDSHTMLSSMSSVRLDNFVYTRESLAEAYRLLRDGGLMVLSFADSEESFLTNRIARMLAGVTGREPLVFRTGYQSSVVALVVARGERTLQTPPALAASQTRLSSPAIREATDDWPYLYLKAPGIPFAYVWIFLALGFMGVLAHAAARRIEGRALLPGVQVDWPMLFLGAGFMLLETRSITSLSLFYGSTWVVNSVVIAVILLAVFLANLAVMNFPRLRPGPVFTLQPIIQAINFRSPVVYLICFGLLSPLALYRGPLNPYGIGIGVYAIIGQLGLLPPPALVAALMSVVQVQTVCDPTNTHNVWIANYVGMRVEEITRETIVFKIAICIIGLAVGIGLYLR
ncbi:MAG: hypothetical protein ACREEM_13710 [Blastocatellia bacterium]